MEVVGAAADTAETVKLVNALVPDVAVIDWMMPGGGGGVAVRQILTENPKVRVLGITATLGEDASYDLLSAGAVGFLCKGWSREELVQSIRSALRW